MRPGKIAVAATTFACVTLLSFGWSEQRGVSLSIESAQARVDHAPSQVRHRGAAHRTFGRAAYAPNPVAAGVGLAAGAIGTAAAATAAATSPWGYGYYGGGPYAGPAPGWGGDAYYASSPWGDYECRAPHAWECRPYASKEWVHP